jgi:hypothetical protein
VATLNELIETLQEMLDDYPELGDQPVNVGYQPNYPLAGVIANVVVIGGDDAEEQDDVDDDAEPALWIAISDNHSEPYAPRAAWEHR